MDPVQVTAQMQGIEWIVVLLIAAVLIFFGSKKLPEFFRSLGRARGELAKGRFEIEQEIAEMKK